jgi:putative nucleotidyltransferase with HDIG domain
MARSTPPRFVVRTTVATLIMVAGVLTAVFVGFALHVREGVRDAVSDKLEAGQRMLSALEQRRERELGVQVATIAENPALRTAVATYKLELSATEPRYRRGMLVAIERQLRTLAAKTGSDVLAVADTSGTVIAVGGRRAADWPMLGKVSARHDVTGAAHVSMASGVFQFASAPLVLQQQFLGTLQLARAFDAHYAQELSALSGAATLITSGDAVVASTLPVDLMKDLTPAAVRSLAAHDAVRLGSSEYAVKQLFQDDQTSVYALDSIDASTRDPMQKALGAVFLTAVGAFALAAFASVWLARTISRPIDTLSKSLSEMTESRDFEHPVRPTGFSLEVDTLTAAFNTMMRSVSAAEAETEDAYVGAIRALALALDARDPYTAGHSERVSAVSVAIGRQMNLGKDDLEILRLGALLHDIGKIGISDAVLRKPGPLTREEFALIEQHPIVGARILRSVRFLTPHLPIVELHHERPDGKGYPHRLRGNEVPLLARIVRVADAFDAMTSARAYRPAHGRAEAMRELWRCAGPQFDAEVVHALSLAVPTIEVAPEGETRAHAASRFQRLAVVASRGAS